MASTCSGPAGSPSALKAAASKPWPPTRTTASSLSVTIAAADRPAWLRFARAANEAFDACGYPLCKGNVMASNPDCCLTADEWRARFAHWIEHGAPVGLAQRQHLFRSAASGRPARAGAAAACDVAARADAGAALHQADGRQHADESRAARLAWGARDARRGRSPVARPQAARNGAVRRGGAAIRAGAWPRRLEHARTVDCGRTGAAGAHRRGRLVGRRVRVPADAAAARATRRPRR